MWKFLRTNPKTLEIEELINYKSAEIRINDFLFEHGKAMIANCIAKSEICTIEDKKNVKKDMYYLLNVRPNPNQTATEFWLDVIERYFSYEGEVLIVNIGSYLYVASSFTKSNDIMNHQIFSNVSVCIDNNYLLLNKSFTSEESMLIKRKDKKINFYLDSVNDKIADLMIAAMSGYKKKSPKYKMKIPNGLRLQDSNGKVIANNEYSQMMSNEMNNAESSVILMPSSLEFDAIKSECNVTTEEIKSIFNLAATNVSLALNIPLNAFLGTITEKSDAIDELITFGVSIIVEQINDAFNYCLMNKNSFLNGNKIFFDLSNSKHRDILSNASAIDKLVADGFSHNEILEMFGKPIIDEEWAYKHNITKNYGEVDDISKGGEE